SVGDGVFRAGLDTEAAEDASAIIDVVDLCITLVDAGPFGSRARIVGRLDVDAFRRASGRAEKAGHAFFPPQLVNVQQMLAAITRLHGDRIVRVFDGLFAFGNVGQRDAHPLNDRPRGIDYF